MTWAQTTEAIRRRRLCPDKWTDVALARLYHVSVPELREAIAAYRAEHRKRDREQRLRELAAREANTVRPLDRDRAERCARLLALEVADMRDLTGRLMGDPLVGRRALDMRGRA